MRESKGEQLLVCAALCLVMFIAACASIPVDPVWGPASVLVGVSAAAALGPLGFLIGAATGASITYLGLWVTAPAPEQQAAHEAAASFPWWSWCVVIGLGFAAYRVRATLIGWVAALVEFGIGLFAKKRRR